jgi:hypothetical protein
MGLRQLLRLAGDLACKRAEDATAAAAGKLPQSVVVADDAAIADVGRQIGQIIASAGPGYVPNDDGSITVFMNSISYDEPWAYRSIIYQALPLD